MLLIGISEYINDIPRLNNCVKDLDDLESVLLEKYDFAPDNIIRFTNGAATRNAILNALRNLKNHVAEKDNVFIVFSGHGVNIGEIGYLIPYDAHLREDAEFISTYDIISRLNELKCHHLFFIVDACFSGAIFVIQKDATERSDESKRSRLGISACHSKEVAYDGAPGENSPFMSSLIQALRTYNDPVTAIRLAAFIIDDVQRQTSNKQTPVFRPLDIRGDEQGQFVLRPKNPSYTFENVLRHLQGTFLEEAAVELFNFLYTNPDLPPTFYFDLLPVKVKINAYREIRTSFLYEEKNDHEFYLEIQRSVDSDLKWAMAQIKGKKNKASIQEESELFKLIVEGNHALLWQEVEKLFPLTDTSYLYLITQEILNLRPSLEAGVLTKQIFIKRYTDDYLLLTIFIRMLLKSKDTVGFWKYFQEEIQSLGLEYGFVLLKFLVNLHSHSELKLFLPEIENRLEALKLKGWILMNMEGDIEREIKLLNTAIQYTAERTAVYPQLYYLEERKDVEHPEGQQQRIDALYSVEESGFAQQLRELRPRLEEEAIHDLMITFGRVNTNFLGSNPNQRGATTSQEYLTEKSRLLLQILAMLKQEQYMFKEPLFEADYVKTEEKGVATGVGIKEHILQLILQSNLDEAVELMKQCLALQRPDAIVLAVLGTQLKQLTEDRIFTTKPTQLLQIRSDQLVNDLLKVLESGAVFE